MSETILGTGCVAALALVVLLALNQVDPRWRIWPTPGAGTWQSLLFWTLFRLANVSVVALAVIDHAPLDQWAVPRLAALVVGVASLGLYGLAVRALGRENLYCGRAGLVTGGIYRWSRNPQYATIIPAYLGLTIAGGTTGGMLLAVLVSIVFLVMAITEERWLALAYGEAYRRYRRVVPRFYNIRRASVLAAMLLGGVRTRLGAAHAGVLQRLAPAVSALGPRADRRPVTTMDRRRTDAARRSP